MLHGIEVKHCRLRRSGMDVGGRLPAVGGWKPIGDAEATEAIAWWTRGHGARGLRLELEGQ